MTNVYVAIHVVPFNQTIFKLVSVKIAFCIRYGDEYLERFSFVVIIDSDTSLTDVEWMLVQAFLFRFVIIAYEVFYLYIWFLLKNV